MPDDKVDLKPYRTALEALISYNRPVKLSQMLGNAAANVEDPELRTVFKAYIAALPRGYAANEPLRMADEKHRFQGVADTIEYIEQIIDAGQLSWEILAQTYGWMPPNDQG